MATNQRQNSVDTKNYKSDISYQNYILSYKKYKNWFGIFYILVFLLFVIITNFQEWTLIFQYQNIKQKNEFLDAFEAGVDEKILNNKTYKLKEIFGARLIDLKYPLYRHPFEYRQDQEGEYFKKRRNFLNSLIPALDDSSKLKVKSYLEKDSLVICNLMDKYKSVVDSALIKNPEMRSFPELANQFVQEVEDSLLSLRNKYLVYIRLPIFRKYDLDGQDLGMNYSEFKQKYRERAQKLRDLDGAQIINLPYIGRSLELGYVFFLSLAVIPILSIYIQILFLNFLINSQKIYKYGKPTIPLPTLKMILMDFNLPSFIINLGSSVLNPSMNLLIPIVCSICMIIVLIYISLWGIIVLCIYLSIVTFLYFYFFKQKKSRKSRLKLLFKNHL